VHGWFGKLQMVNSCPDEVFLGCKRGKGLMIKEIINMHYLADAWLIFFEIFEHKTFLIRIIWINYEKYNFFFFFYK
jgi:hypothetical protein